MENSETYIWIQHYKKSVKTIHDLMDKEFIFDISDTDFFESNRDIIFNQMSVDEIQDYATALGKETLTAADLKIDMILPRPCSLRISAKKVTAEIAISQSNVQVNEDDFYAFADEKIQKVLQGSVYEAEHLSKIKTGCTVLGWFKSKYYFQKLQSQEVVNNNPNSAFLEIGKFIQSMNTSNGKNGGSFSIKLPILSFNQSGDSLGKFNDDGTWEDHVIYATGILDDWGGQLNKNLYEYASEEFYSKISANDGDFNFFNWLISANDLLFLKFDKIFVGDVKTELANSDFDMIALVDEVTTVKDANGNMYVEVSGRDLMKLLIEDGSFFFQSSTCANPNYIFQNSEGYGKQGDYMDANQMEFKETTPFDRVRWISGEIDIFANRINMDISFIIKGVLAKLTNIEIVPGEIFESWGNDRTKYIDLKPTE